METGNPLRRLNVKPSRMLIDFVETFNSLQKCVGAMKVLDKKTYVQETNIDNIVRIKQVTEKVNSIIEIINIHIASLEKFVPINARKQWQLPIFVQSEVWNTEDVFESIFNYFSVSYQNYEKHEIFEIVKIINRIYTQMIILWENIPLTDCHHHQYLNYILLVMFPEAPKKRKLF